MSADDDEIYGLVLPFDSDDLEFTRGFEAGMIWQQMQMKVPVIEQHLSGANAEMAMRMAEIEDYTFSAEDLSNDWYWIKLTKEV